MDEHVLLEKVFDAGANTIWSEMKKLRGQAPEQKDNMRRRWIWELIQNASDCAYPDKGVNISVKYDTINKHLQFAHDGKPFIYENLIDLITQISSKQSDTEEKTGKFGTGFISTHLLSEKVKLNGILQDSNNCSKRLECIIDRSGTDYQSVRENIKTSLTAIQTIRNGNANIVPPNSDIKTTFTYAIENEDAHQAVLVGLEDLKSTVSYILAFNRNIGSISCDDFVYRIESSHYILDRMFEMIKIRIPQGSYSLLCKRENDISILFSVLENTPLKYQILPYSLNTPKLFCNFPLIGTENFSFPMIVNCSKFEIEKDRNAIHEGNAYNMHILETANNMYNSLLTLAANEQWEDIYNICFCSQNSNSQLQQKLYKNVLSKIKILPIVNTNCNGRIYGKTSFFIQQNGKTALQIYIPKAPKEDLDDEFWEIVNAFSKFLIPSKSSYKEWWKIFPYSITVDNFNEWFKEQNFDYVKENCHSDCYAWLNLFYSFWMKSVKWEDFYEKAYVLNQEQNFIELKVLFRDDNIDEKLKDILNELGENIRKTLLSREMNLSINDKLHSRDNKYIAKRIQDRINQLLSEETVNNTKRNQRTQMTFNKLTNWFLEKPDESSELFDTLYNKRNMLSSVEENIRRFRIAEKVESKNITENQLDMILDNHSRIDELLSNYDSLSLEEIKSELKHISLHDKNRFDYYQSILERTIENVHQYLKDTGKYDIADTVAQWKEDQYSSTVFPAKKDGRDIRIIIRPSDYNKIIFFYDQELTALDDSNYELWTDNENNDTRMISLGDILKTTKITVIPLRNLYNE